MGKHSTIFDGFRLLLLLIIALQMCSNSSNSFAFVVPVPPGTVNSNLSRSEIIYNTDEVAVNSNLKSNSNSVKIGKLLTVKSESCNYDDDCPGSNSYCSVGQCKYCASDRVWNGFHCDQCTFSSDCPDSGSGSGPGSNAHCFAGECYNCEAGEHWNGVRCEEIFKCTVNEDCSGGDDAHCYDGECYNCDSNGTWNGYRCMDNEAVKVKIMYLLLNSFLSSNKVFREEVMAGLAVAVPLVVVASFVTCCYCAGCTGKKFKQRRNKSKRSQEQVLVDHEIQNDDSLL